MTQLEMKKIEMLKGLRQPPTGTAPLPKTLAKTQSQSLKRAPEWKVDQVEEQLVAKVKEGEQALSKIQKEKSESEKL